MNNRRTVRSSDGSMPDAFDDLPDMLAHVARHLGMDAAMRLASEMGGEEHKIPAKPQGSTLERRVGTDIASILSAEWPGIAVSIPKFHERIAADRRRRVLTQPHKSVNALARELGITSRQVRHIRAAARDAVDPDQTSMFD